LKLTVFLQSFYVNNQTCNILLISINQSHLRARTGKPGDVILCEKKRNDLWLTYSIPGT